MAVVLILTTFVWRRAIPRASTYFLLGKFVMYTYKIPFISLSLSLNPRIQAHRQTLSPPEIPLPCINRKTQINHDSPPHPHLKTRSSITLSNHLHSHDRTSQSIHSIAHSSYPRIPTLWNNPIQVSIALFNTQDLSQQSKARVQKYVYPPRAPLAKSQ